MNYIELIQADNDRLEEQCKKVTITRLPSTINRPRKPIKF